MCYFGVCCAKLNGVGESDNSLAYASHPSIPYIFRAHLECIFSCQDHLVISERLLYAASFDKTATHFISMSDPYGSSFTATQLGKHVSSRYVLWIK